MSDQTQLPMDEWKKAQSMALSCPEFKPDVEEEWLAEETVSCYNCRYRRFVGSGIRCMKALFSDFQINLMVRIEPDQDLSSRS